MTFMAAGVEMMLKGDYVKRGFGLSKASVSLKSMFKALKSQEGAISELGSIAIQFKESCQKTLDMISEVPRAFSPVFRFPTAFLHQRAMTMLLLCN